MAVGVVTTGSTAAVPVSAAAAGFDAWYRHEHPRVLAALTWIAGDVDVARDATDEAFARAVLHWRRVQTMASPGGWTQRVAVNLVRRRMRRAAMERDVGSRPSPVPVADTELWLVVRRLPQRQREAVVLRYLLDLPDREVAAVMRVSPGTVASTLAAARARLATWLQDDEERER